MYDMYELKMWFVVCMTLFFFSLFPQHRRLTFIHQLLIHQNWSQFASVTFIRYAIEMSFLALYTQRIVIFIHLIISLCKSMNTRSQCANIIKSSIELWIDKEGSIDWIYLHSTIYGEGETIFQFLLYLPLCLIMALYSTKSVHEISQLH